MRIRRRRLLSGIVFGCAIAYAALAAGAQTTAPNEWTWVGGSNTTGDSVGRPGVYGTLGAPAAGNIPGARDSAATWTDSSGKFWLFGGEGPDANGVFGQMNDLWEFNPSTSEWTWMGGSSTLPTSCAADTTTVCGQPGVYGTEGTPAAQNIPGGRSVTTYWTDRNGNFWLFGGGGIDADGNPGYLNDLWMFSPSTGRWAWIAGSGAVGSSGGQAGVYGISGTPATENNPGGRGLAQGWIDTGGNLWLFGGQGFDGQGNYGQLNDLWEFNSSTEEWVWISGSSTIPGNCATSAFNGGLCGWPPVYGPLGVPAAGISPGSRVGAANWTDKDGNFWLFGGLGNVFWTTFDFSLINQYDLWEFNPSTSEWAWMGGDNTLICEQIDPIGDSCNENGVTGMLGVPAVGNIPASRDGATSWTDATGALWLFGGNHSPTMESVGDLYCDDIWQFNPSVNEWAWMGGNPITAYGFGNCGVTPGSWGDLGTASTTNIPSGRLGAAVWTDKSGNFWMFGGFGWGSNFSVNADDNDLWVYQPTTPAPTPSFELVASPNPMIIEYSPGGATGTTTIGVVDADGFDSPVALTAASFIANNGATTITGSLSPSTITGAGTSQLTISVSGAGGPIGTNIPFTITGTSAGVSQSADVLIVATGGGQVPAPTFSEPAGTYTAPQTVSINDSYRGGSTIDYYTTDGTTPSLNSPVYVSPITISSTTTLMAIATSSNNTPSAVVSALYTIVPAAAAPTFSPDGGTYEASQSVTMADSTAGAVIYYTINGLAPTTSSAQYTGAITVSTTETIQASAIAAGGSMSPVASATYTINMPAPNFSVTGVAITVAPGATSGNTSTISLTPSGGFTGEISLSCAITPVAASDPATCSIPGSITIIGPAAQTTTLTVETTAATSALNKGGRLFWPSVGGGALACILLAGIPARRRSWRGTLGICVLLILLAGGVISCGGASSGDGGGGGNPGTTPGSYTVTVAGTSGAITQTGTVSLTVQ